MFAYTQVLLGISLLFFALPQEDTTHETFENVCVHVIIYVYVYVYLYVHVYVCVYVHVFVCVCVNNTKTEQKQRIYLFNL